MWLQQTLMYSPRLSQHLQSWQVTPNCLFSEDPPYITYPTFFNFFFPFGKILKPQPTLFIKGEEVPTMIYKCLFIYSKFEAFPIS